MLLAIDTATPTLSLALFDGYQVHAESTWRTVNRHTVELAPAIQKMLTGLQLSPSDLTALAVSQGPGSFNGLRIGFSVAQGLALALNIPLIAVPTLDITVAPQPSFKGNLLAVAQAGRGRIVACTYRWRTSAWVSMNDTRIDSWDHVLAAVTSETLVTGEIDAAGRRAITASVKPLHLAAPASMLRRAGHLAAIAWARWQENPSMGTPAVPIYLHQPGVPHP